MSVPDGLLIAGAVVGLAGGAIGVVTGSFTIVGSIRRAGRAKRDAEMVLDLEFGGVEGFGGVDTKMYPYATARLSNNGKVTAKDLRVVSSTGYALFDATTLFPDNSEIITFPLVAVRDLPIDRLFEGDEKDKWAPIETPYRVGEVRLSITWRIDGTSERSEPTTFTHAYSESPSH